MKKVLSLKVLNLEKDGIEAILKKEGIAYEYQRLSDGSGNIYTKSDIEALEVLKKLIDYRVKPIIFYSNEEKNRIERAKKAVDVKLKNIDGNRKVINLFKNGIVDIFPVDDLLLLLSFGINTTYEDCLKNILTVLEYQRLKRKELC